MNLGGGEMLVTWTLNRRCKKGAREAKSREANID